jgi:hypothetical protein
MGEVLPFARRLSVFLPVVKVFHIQTALPALFFPQVENPVEKVQNSSVQACFPGGIPHFPQGFPQSYLDRLRTLHTFCNFQVRIMTKF